MWTEGKLLLWRYVIPKSWEILSYTLYSREAKEGKVE